MNSKKEIEVVKLVSQIVDLLSKKEKKRILQKILGEENNLPISIFKTKGLSGLEAVTIYLKDHKNQPTKKVAANLKRKLSTIYTTCTNAKRKLKGKELDCSDNSVTIPIKMFSQRKFSVLESLVFYLNQEKRIPLKKISILLNKNYNTVKTVFWRYNQKQSGTKNAKK